MDELEIYGSPVGCRHIIAPSPEYVRAVAHAAERQTLFIDFENSFDMNWAEQLGVQP